MYTHRVHQGVTGYYFQIKLYFFLCENLLSLSKQ